MTNEIENGTVAEIDSRIPQIEVPMSPYKFAEVADVRPQMIYNYIKKGWIPTRVGETGKKVIDVTPGNEWLVRYYTKNRLTEV
jgi:hypothetical protein